MNSKESIIIFTFSIYTFPLSVKNNVTKIQDHVLWDRPGAALATRGRHIDDGSAHCLGPIYTIVKIVRIHSPAKRLYDAESHAGSCAVHYAID